MWKEKPPTLSKLATVLLSHLASRVNPDLPQRSVLALDSPNTLSPPMIDPPGFAAIVVGLAPLHALLYKVRCVATDVPGEGGDSRVKPAVGSSEMVE